jgi:GNAT superfamily N-acetyltransferase
MPHHDDPHERLLRPLSVANSQQPNRAVLQTSNHEGNAAARLRLPRTIAPGKPDAAGRREPQLCDMAWTATSSPDEFVATAGEHLRSDPVQNTVLLTVLETLRRSGPLAFGDGAPSFGWHESGSGEVDGAFLQTPPFPVLAASLPAGSAASLIELLTADGKRPAGVNVVGSDEADVTAAWLAAAGAGTSARLRSRLFRLDRLVPPDPYPPGSARLASQDDFDLLVDWHNAFTAEAEAGGGRHADRNVADRLSHHGLMLWEADGRPVAMAGLTRNVAGVIRVAPVYTLPGQRQRGYGGAVTTAVSQAALDAGADAVVLFTDQANPTSNALYQRLGYVPISDRVLLDFEPPVAGRRGCERLSRLT